MVSTSRKIGRVAIPLVFLIAIAFGYAYFVEPFRLIINQKQIEIAGWDPEFEGFRAVLISDIHGGSQGGDEASIKRIVEAANEQKADAIFLLGDYVSQQRVSDTGASERLLQMPVGEVTALLGNLKAKFGVYAVLGNHDDSYNGQAVSEELERVGINVLNGKVATIEKDRRVLRILGLRDHLQAGSWADFSKEAKDLLRQTEGKGNIIVLEHSPDVIEMITGDLAISNDTKLMFAGHTHGGQVWLPILGSPIVPSSYGQKYAAGYIRDRGIDLFVTTGTGTSILPFRFLVPPEIAVVTISAK